MTRFFRNATLPILAVLTFAASTAQAVPISLESFRAAAEDSRAPAKSYRAKPTLAKPATQAQAMVCTTQRTTTKAGLFRRKTTKSTTVCTPAKTTPVAVPAAQAPAVEILASTELAESAAPVVPVASASRPRNPAPTPNGNVGGNSTNVGSNSYVSPVISAPALFAPGSGESAPGELIGPMASIEAIAEVPEPATLALLGLGLAGLGLARRRSQK